VGIQCENFPLYPDEPTSATRLILESVKIRNCSAAGILSRNYSITATNLLVGDCGQYGVALTGGGDYLFDQFTIANYWDLEIRQTPAFYMNNAYRSINNQLQIRPVTNSRFLNGIVHGANSNEFLLEFDGLLPPELLRFDRFMVRTDQSTTGTFFLDQSTIHRNQSPAFRNVSTRDLHLSSNSFARGRGLDQGTPGTLFDMDGTFRQSVRDLGCYEFVE
jgi:hypothetical protein